MYDRYSLISIPRWRSQRASPGRIPCFRTHTVRSCSIISVHVLGGFGILKMGVPQMSPWVSILKSKVIIWMMQGGYLHFSETSIWNLAFGPLDYTQIPGDGPRQLKESLGSTRCATYELCNIDILQMEMNMLPLISDLYMHPISIHYFFGCYSTAIRDDTWEKNKRLS